MHVHPEPTAASSIRSRLSPKHHYRKARTKDHSKRPTRGALRFWISLLFKRFVSAAMHVGTATSTVLASTVSGRREEEIGTCGSSAFSPAPSLLFLRRSVNVRVSSEQAPCRPPTVRVTVTQYATQERIKQVDGRWTVTTKRYFNRLRVVSGLDCTCLGLLQHCDSLLTFRLAILQTRCDFWERLEKQMAFVQCVSSGVDSVRSRRSRVSRVSQKGGF